MTGVLVKRGYLDTDIHTEKMLCEDEGRDQGDASTIQATQKRARIYQKLGERPETDSPAQPQKETALPTNTFSPPEP